MKKILNVNIGSDTFTINEDAYFLLNEYYEDVRSRLFDTDRQKVMDDVEARTAHIFRTDISDGSQIVDIELVRHAISVIGVPHTFGNRIYDRNYVPPQDGRQPRRLYRSRTNAVIAGVCGGVAKYFDIDPSIVRLITLLLILFLGLSLWVYIILWIILPLEPVSNITSERRARRNARRG